MYQKYFKRLLDIFICLCLFPTLIIIYILVAITIKLDDKGPVIYKSKRIGKNFKIFIMYKFRSMKVNVPFIINADGSIFNSKTDERVTRVGRVLRETSIDELPQIINVLKGDMSLIGPRPGDVESINTYAEDEKDKVLVRPGITGYTQAYYRNSINVREKRLLDAWYVHNVSFKLDFKILLKTFVTVVKREGLYTNE